jgi:hypothetical protein
MRYGKHVLRQWLQRAFLVSVGACGPWVGATGCQGSEHVVLAPILAAPINPSGGSSGGGAGGSGPMDGGNSQELDAADPEPEASVPEIDSGLDPTVRFDWTETLPGPGTCGPNTFVGIFSCTSGSRLVPFVSQITIEVSDALMGESLLGVTGNLGEPPTPTLTSFGADIEGSLDCTKNSLDAWTTGGRATFLGFDARFDSKIIGAYDPQTLEMIGEITLYITFLAPEGVEPETCRGSFQVGAPL